MTLHESPRTFAQRLKMTLSATPADAPVVVVEGGTDRRMLLPFLRDDAEIVSARGKQHVLEAFGIHSHDRRTLFIVDCDGGVDESFKGKSDLVITENRDIEADIVFLMDALPRVIMEIARDNRITGAKARQLAREASDAAESSAIALGMVLDAARSVDARTRLVDRATGQVRRIRPSDLAAVGWRVMDEPSVQSLASTAAPLLGWPEAAAASIADSALAMSHEECARHGSTECRHCRRWRYCNGHALVDACAVILSIRTRTPIDYAGLDQFLRLAVDRDDVARWRVYRRIAQWEVRFGIPVLRQREA